MELISAHDNHNVHSIWKHALDMREMLGPENLKRLRHDQMHKSMWNFLSDTLLQRLKAEYNHEGGHPNKYSEVI